MDVRPAPDGFGYVLHSEDTTVWLGTEARAVRCAAERFGPCEVRVATPGRIPQRFRYR